MKKIIITFILLTAFVPTSFAASRINRDEIKKQFEEKVPEEVQNQIESAVYQVGYQVLKVGLTKASEVLTKITAQIDAMPTSKLSEDAKNILNSTVKDLSTFIGEEQSKLNNAKAIPDLKIIQEDIVAEIKTVVGAVQKYMIDNADQIAAKTEQAIKVLETTCGADTTNLQAMLDDFNTKVATAKKELENSDQTQEELKNTAKNFDPSVFATEIQSLTTELQSLATQCKQ